MPASEPTTAKSANGKDSPISTPAPTAWTSATSSAGPMPATRLTTIGPAANGMA